MPKSLKSIGLISVFLILSSTALFATEQITITTYYPSPYGVYRELRSQRMAIGETYIKHDTVCWEGAPINCDGLGGQTMIPSANNVDLIVEGRVGIGTAAPRSTLDVSTHHDYNVERTITAESVHEANRYGLGFKYWTNSVGTTFKTITEYEGANEYNTLSLKAGNVGIGVTVPNTLLSVNSPYASAGVLYPIVTSQSGVTTLGGMYSVGEGAMGGTSGLAFQVFKAGVGLTESLRISNSGNVGIGTTAPQAKLDVNGGVKVGPDDNANTTCPAVKAGTVRYNSGTMEYCDGSNWKAMSGDTLTCPSDMALVPALSGSRAFCIDKNESASTSVIWATRECGLVGKHLCYFEELKIACATSGLGIVGLDNNYELVSDYAVGGCVGCYVHIGKCSDFTHAGATASYTYRCCSR